MKRYGQLVRLKPESRQEYPRHHGAVWPGVLKTIAECNIRNYSIFEYEDLLFAWQVGLSNVTRSRSEKELAPQGLKPSFCFFYVRAEAGALQKGKTQPRG